MRVGTVSSSFVCFCFYICYNCNWCCYIN